MSVLTGDISFRESLADPWSLFTWDAGSVSVLCFSLTFCIAQESPLCSKEIGGWIGMCN